MLKLVMVILNMFFPVSLSASTLRFISALSEQSWLTICPKAGGLWPLGLTQMQLFGTIQTLN